MTSRNLTSPGVARKCLHLTGSHLEVAVEGLCHVFGYVWAPTGL